MTVKNLLQNCIFKSVIELFWLHTKLLLIKSFRNTVAQLGQCRVRMIAQSLDSKTAHYILKQSQTRFSKPTDRDLSLQDYNVSFALCLSLHHCWQSDLGRRLKADN